MDPHRLLGEPGHPGLDPVARVRDGDKLGHARRPAGPVGHGDGGLGDDLAHDLRCVGGHPSLLTPVPGRAAQFLGYQLVQRRHPCGQPAPRLVLLRELPPVLPGAPVAAELCGDRSQERQVGRREVVRRPLGPDAADEPVDVGAAQQTHLHEGGTGHRVEAGAVGGVGRDAGALPGIARLHCAGSVGVGEQGVPAGRLRRVLQEDRHLGGVEPERDEPADVGEQFRELSAREGPLRGLDVGVVEDRVAGLDQREGLALPHRAAQLRKDIDELDDGVEDGGERLLPEQGQNPPATIDVVDRQRPRDVVADQHGQAVRNVVRDREGASVERERGHRVGVDLGLEDRGWRRHVEPAARRSRARPGRTGRRAPPEHRTEAAGDLREGAYQVVGGRGALRIQCRTDERTGPRASGSPRSLRRSRRQRCRRLGLAVPPQGPDRGLARRRSSERASSVRETTVPSSPACSSASSWNTWATWPISAVSLPNGEWTRSASSVRAHCRRWTETAGSATTSTSAPGGAHPSKSSAAERARCEAGRRRRPRGRARLAAGPPSGTGRGCTGARVRRRGCAAVARGRPGLSRITLDLRPGPPACDRDDQAVDGCDGRRLLCGRQVDEAADEAEQPAVSQQRLVTEAGDGLDQLVRGHRIAGDVALREPGDGDTQLQADGVHGIRVAAELVDEQVGAEFDRPPGQPAGQRRGEHLTQVVHRARHHHPPTVRRRLAATRRQRLLGELQASPGTSPRGRGAEGRPPGFLVGPPGGPPPGRRPATAPHRTASRPARRSRGWQRCPAAARRRTR